VILDPFGGSGTTAAATARKNPRQCAHIGISQKYCNMTTHRLQLIKEEQKQQHLDDFQGAAS